ncbi:MAG: hypothetical protein WBA97_08805 [Actinophytocola sp.]|uniref:hypothetical protein n=1 Tax=Actinophytocola sp. TaxID=1872138 RepID=UPI003C73DCF3
MSKFKQGAVLVAALASVLTGAVVNSAPAAAASSPISACGGGSYHVIDSQDLNGLATVYLLYNGSTNCVVTWHSSATAGTARYTAAAVQKAGGNPVEDAGSYTTYAGPVKVSAAGSCILWGGAIADGNGRIYGYESPWSHCG